MRIAEGRRTLTALALLCAACSATEVLREVALETGRHMLKSSIASNYGASYEETVDRMLEGLVTATRPNTLVNASAPEGDGEWSPGLDPDAGEESARTPIELEVAVLRESKVGDRFIPIPLADGDVVRDGVGREEVGDNIKIRFEVNQACYVYAVWIDATGWVTPIFPKSTAYSHQNPIAADVEYNLPEGNQWFFLDDYRGVENLYFIASHEPIASIESALADLLGRTRTFQSDVQEPAIVTEPVPVTRGIGGIRQGMLSAVQTSDNKLHDVQSQVFIAEFASSELVVSRWFRHE